MGGGRRRVEPRRPTDAMDTAIINQIMLRFRPIAPKPTDTDGSFPGNQGTKGSESVTKKRVKRKYFRVQKQKPASLPKPKNKGGAQLALNRTDSRLPQALHPEMLIGERFAIVDPVRERPNRTIDFGASEKRDAAGILATPAADLEGRFREIQSKRPGKVVESWITVECVTGICEAGRWLGSTDEERVRNLERDTCPGFVTNCGEGGVDWVNLAYRRMVGGGEEEEEVVMVVRLVTKDKVVQTRPAFSCRVRLVYYHHHTSRGRDGGEKAGEEKEKRKRITQMTVPCDAWKMDFGGFAWRLDVEAALRLGR